MLNKIILQTILCGAIILIVTCQNPEKDMVYDDGIYTLDTLTTEIANPWGIKFISQDNFLVTDKNGKLYLVNTNKALHEISGLPELFAKGQGGLLDVEVHPDFDKNQFIYLSYSKVGKEENESTTAIYKAILSGNSLQNGKDIFVSDSYSTKQHHFGSRIEFGNDGYLYFSVGDRGNRDENPQDLSRDPGKIHRITDDGEIPDSNPFVTSDSAKQSIYSYGHRNPQGMAKHPQTGKIWINEHGPQGGDEINIIEKGLNYGWPIISYGINYDNTKFTELTVKDGMQQPLLHWTPSIAPCGMTFITGKRYPALEGHLLCGSLKFRYIENIELENETVISQTKLFENIGRIREITQSPSGEIYFIAESPGGVYKIVSKQ